MLRKTIFVLNILFCTLIFAQNPKTAKLNLKAYNDLINYAPKNLVSDSIYQPENKYLNVKLNTMGGLRVYCRLAEDIKFSENDKKWLKKKVDQMATALFLDGKRILFSAVGGYSGCPDKLMDTIWLNNIEITNLKICHSCIDSYLDENFIETFNSSMYSLMKIEPPNRKTNTFYGEYKGRDKERFPMKLILFKDRKFKFNLSRGHGSDFTEGLWENKNDTLILNSRILNKPEDIFISMSSGKWIKFKNLKFRLKKRKLSELNNGKRKLKKIKKKK